MTDLDTLRPEVAQALGFIERNQKYGDGSVCAGDIDIIRAELLRLTGENMRLSGRLCLVCGLHNDSQCPQRNDEMSPCTFDPSPVEAAKAFFARATKAEAELAALKARIAGAPLVEIANIGDPFIVLPDHFTVPHSLKGKSVRLVVEE